MYQLICSRGLALAVCGSLVFAQSPNAQPTSSSSPVQVKRVPVAQTPSQKQDQADPLIQKYDFGGQLRALQDPDSDRPSKVWRAGGWKFRTRRKSPKRISSANGCTAQSDCS